jgi:hypothetical protein
MFNMKKLAMVVVFIAIGIVLPLTGQSVPDSESMTLSMHLPVLICGLLLGAPYGLACGILTPLISTLFTSTPAMTVLPVMVCELAVYGCLTGLLLQLLEMENATVKAYMALIIAMLAGRIVAGALNAFAFQAGAYSWQMWFNTYFVTGLPGIIIQLGAVPYVVSSLRKSKFMKEAVVDD